MFWSPAISRMIAKPRYFQVRIAISVHSDMCGPSQEISTVPKMCILVSRSLIAPFTGSIRLRPVPAMTSETTHGTKTSTRITERPRILRFSSSASRIASGPWISSESTTISKLCITARWNSGSVRMTL